MQPKTRIEYFLNKIAEANGGSGSGGDSGLVLELTAENDVFSPNGSLNFVYRITYGDRPENLFTLEPGRPFAIVSALESPVIVRHPSWMPEVPSGTIDNLFVSSWVPVVLRPIPEPDPNWEATQKVYTLKSDIRGYSVATNEGSLTVIADRPEFVEGYIEAYIETS